jgi:hypothetical protein
MTVMTPEQPTTDMSSFEDAFNHDNVEHIHWYPSGAILCGATPPADGCPARSSGVEWKMGYERCPDCKRPLCPECIRIAVLDEACR